MIDHMNREGLKALYVQYLLTTVIYTRTLASSHSNVLPCHKALVMALTYCVSNAFLEEVNFVLCVYSKPF